MTLRILWCSDAADASSGYSQITRQQAPKLAELGHDVALLATFGHHGAVREWMPPHWKESGRAPMRVYPGGADSFANDVIGWSARDWKADIVITLKDSFVFKPEAFQGLRWVGMVPVDHEPLPPAIAQIVRAMYRPIAYAPNGFRALRKAGFDPLFCPHSFDPRILHPEDKKAARKHLGLPDDLFIIGTVAVNRGGFSSRKAWPQNLEAFAIFAKDKPKARYFLHTDLAQDGFEGGINIPAYIAQLSGDYGWDVGSRLLFCDQEKYRRGLFPDEYFLAYYNSIDVLNAVSRGEGFGLPGLESQACGTPVIMSDFAAHRDLLFGGWHVTEGIRDYDGQGAYTFLPSAGAIATAMEEAYRAKSESPKGPIPFDLENGNVVPRYETMKLKAALGAQQYALDTVIERHWKPALEELEQRIALDSAGRGVLRIIRPEEVGVAA